MPTILDFAKIAKLDGVKNFILIRKDGQVMTHNMEKPETISPFIVLCGLNADAIGVILSLQQMTNITVSRENREHLHIFPAGNYFAAVFQKSDAYPPDVIKNVSKFIGTIIAQPRKMDGRTTFDSKLD
jgi:hypothetical protein